MPKVSVYLPEPLYRAAKDRKLSISKLTQRAIEQELKPMPINDWVAMMRTRPRLDVGEFDTADLMDEVKTELWG